MIKKYYQLLLFGTYSFLGKERRMDGDKNPLSFHC